jgi:hypothetical protein
MKNQKNNFLIALLKSKLSTFKSLFSWHFTLKSKNLFFLPLLRVVSLIRGKFSNAFISALFVLTWRLVKITARNGSGFSSRYMKYCSLFTMKYIAGERLPTSRSSTYDLRVSLTKRGLPRIIPTYFRSQINSNNPEVIRTVLTVFGLYRVLPFKGIVKLSTIYEPWIGSYPNYLKDYIPIFLDLLNLKINSPTPNIPSFSFEPFPLKKKGSFASCLHVPKKIFREFVRRDNSKYRLSYNIPLWEHGNSFSGFILSLIHLNQHPELWQSVQWFILKGYKEGYRGFTPLTHLQSLVDKLKLFLHDRHLKFWKDAAGGKLAFKDEPGKVRVFAMVDCITQWILDPLHQWIFSVLKDIEVRFGTDATFDQDGAVLRLQKLLKNSQRAYSFDLSAATDRLPIIIQVDLLNHIVPKLGDNWSNLLINRDYSVPINAEGKSRIRYKTGQPMGALSSWGMLALTHHLIIQCCAYQIYKKKVWFRKYLVLGDDVVILDKRVADEYLLMMKILDVGINLSKSLFSMKGFAEFAKKFVCPDFNLSPVSLKEFQSLYMGWCSILELIRKHTLSLYKFLKFIGFGSLASGQLKWSWSSDWTQKRWFFESHFLLRYGKAHFFLSLFEWFYIYFFIWIKKEISKGHELLKSMEKFTPSLRDWGRMYKLKDISTLEFIKSKYLSYRWFDEIVLPFSLDWVPRIDKASRFDKSLVNPRHLPYIHRKLIRPEVLNVVLEFLQLHIFRLFRGSSLWFRLVYDISPNFTKKFKIWMKNWDTVLRLYFFEIQNIRFIYCNEFYKGRDISYMSRYIKTRPNTIQNKLDLLEKFFILMDENPLKVIGRNLPDTGDPSQLEFLLRTKPSMDHDEIKLHKLEDLSQLVVLKSKLWFQWHYRHQIKQIDYDINRIKEASYLSLIKKDFPKV